MEATEDLLSARRRADEVRADLRFTLVEDDTDHVRWVEHGRSGASFHAAPIDVSAALQEHLFSRVSAAVLTSATLTVGGEFGFMRTRLGLADARGLTVSSSFDYGNQAILYLPPGMPPPHSKEFYPAATAVIRELLAITGGGAFLLFTSYAGLHRTRRLLDQETVGRPTIAPLRHESRRIRLGR